MPQSQTHPAMPPESDVYDAVLIGGGIMSATLASMMTVLQPNWRIVVIERGATVAGESTNPWHNAGTGHSGYCELNYMPDPSDPRKPAEIARQFLATRQWWSELARRHFLDPRAFLASTAHLDVVFGPRDVEYLRQRYATLRENPWFAAIEFTDDPATISAWAPLLMAGRSGDEPIAATRHPAGTDVDFGRLTDDLLAILAANGGHVRLGHDVRSLRRAEDGVWAVSGKTQSRKTFTVRGRFVFVGAGGKALSLLQRAKVPEVRGYGVLPVGAAFLRCTDPKVTARHGVKVYGQAELGAPPMSVPHLDKRIVGGRECLMFGPYATFSTKLLRHGRWTDFFTTVRGHNIRVLTAAALDNRDLVVYLVRQLTARRKSKFAQLQRYYPEADAQDWELVPAGQRAQLVTPDIERTGVLQSGTELVVGADGSIAGLLGASPGASTAVSIMLDLLRRAFPDQWSGAWQSQVHTIVPAHDHSRSWSTAEIAQALGDTAAALHLGQTHRS